jgi:NADPH-dependent 2,4-dienoyl-CoA reductase/sulfur reductase-like enzyme/rhodanese-related sulfurtransferase
VESSLHVLIVGGVACGPKTASRLKRLLPDAQVTMIDRGTVLSYGACGLPYYVEGMYPKIEELNRTPFGAPRDAAFFEKVKGFKTLTRTEAIEIDRQEKKVLVRNLDSGKEESIPYDKLVLATGGRPFKPPFPGLELDNVWFMRHMDDAQSMASRIDESGLKKAVVVGAGYIGVEMAEALRTRGLDVTVIELFDQILPQFLDTEMALLAAKHIRQKGVELALGEKVMALEGSGKVTSVKTDKRTIPTDLVVIGVGVLPNDELARKADIACAAKGGILIDSYCRTNDPDIYAGGDCVVNHYIDPITRTPLFVPLGSTSNKHGRTIADHIAGRPTQFLGVTATGICRAFDFTLGRTGLTEKQARELDPDIETAVWAGPDRPHYVPQSKPLIIKMVASRRSRKLLGFQVVGKGDASKRLDVAASALYFGATVDQIAGIDLGYAPPYSSPIDAIAAAAHLMANKLDGVARGISPQEARRRIDGDDKLTIIDVRTSREFQKARMPYPNVVNIPLAELRERHNEIPNDCDIFVNCGVGMRAYEAQRILNAAGFDRVWSIEGGITGWPFELSKGN